MRLMLALLLTGALAPPLAAQDAPVVPGSVSSVEAGGYWSSGGVEGQYRLIIDTGGMEHVVSQAFLQWLSQPRDAEGSVVVITSVPLTELNTGVWRFDSPAFQLRHGVWEATIDGLNSHTQPPVRARWCLRLGPPGVYSVVAE